MNTTARRATLRTNRQKERLATILPASFQDFPMACKQFVLFGDEKKRPLDTYIKRWNS